MFSAAAVAEADRVAALVPLQTQARRVISSPDVRARETWLVGLTRHVTSGSQVHRSSVALLAGGLLLHGALRSAAGHGDDGMRTRAGGRRWRRCRREFSGDTMTPEQAAATLGVHLTTLTRDNLREAYNKLALVNHPDKGGSVSLMAPLNVAKEVLQEWLVGGDGVSPTASASSMHHGGWVECQEFASAKDDFWAQQARCAQDPGACGASTPQMALVALIATAVVAAAVYFLWYRPRRRRRQQEALAMQARQLELSQAVHSAAERLQGTTPLYHRTGSVRGTQASAATATVADTTVGIQQARQVEHALRLPVWQTGGALGSAIHWAHRQLAAAWQGLRATASRTAAVVTRFVKQWTPVRWWQSSLSPAPPEPVHTPATTVVPAAVPLPPLTPATQQPSAAATSATPPANQTVVPTVRHRPRRVHRAGPPLSVRSRPQPLALSRSRSRGRTPARTRTRARVQPQPRPRRRHWRGPTPHHQRPRRHTAGRRA
jgi:hypothetical protein